MNNFFKLKEHNTTVRTEIVAGLTTFFALAYIVFVNPSQVAAGGASGWLVGLGADAGQMGQIFNSVYVASIIVAVIGTLLMAFYAKLPFAQACGMGLNSFFCTSFVAGAFFGGADVIEGYQSGLVIILLAGLVFLFLSLTGLRQYVAKAMPDCLKKAIPAGIGLFIAFIGFQNSGLIQANEFTFVQFVDIHGAVNAGTMNEVVIPAVIAFIGLIIISVLTKLKVKGNVIVGILVSTILYYLLTWSLPSFDMSAIGTSFKDFAAIGVTGVFKASSWKNAFSADYIGGIFNAIMLIVTFCLVDMFDTIGTLYGTAAEANMLDENGDPENLDKAMASDSIATVSGAILGTSTCTTFVESAAGVAAGGRTGLTSLVTAICLGLCLFLTPIASMIPACAAAPALIFVGVLMVKNFSKVDFTDMRSAVPAFLALIMMPLTYSIANGIGIGAIAYVLITIFTGKFKKQDIVITIIALLFAVKFIFVTM